MSLDYIQRHQQGDTSELAFNDLLIDLASRLQSDGGRYITKLNINYIYIKINLITKLEL